MQAPAGLLVINETTPMELVGFRQEIARSHLCDMSRMCSHVGLFPSLRSSSPWVCGLCCLRPWGHRDRESTSHRLSVIRREAEGLSAANISKERKKSHNEIR